MHDLLLGLQLNGLSKQGCLLALSFAIKAVLVTEIEVKLNFTRVFGLQAESIYNVAFTLLVEVLCTDHLLHLMDSN